jgi:hypothetical protein
MIGQARQTLRENGGVLAEPQLIASIGSAQGREVLHGLVSVRVRNMTQMFDQHK